MKNKGIITGIILIFLGFTAFILTREVIIDQPAPPQKPKPQKPVAVPASYPLTFTSGKVKLILTDFTRVPKPDNQCWAAACKEFVSLVNSANSTIDMAVFGWEDVPAVTTALQSALERGVQIRLVYDQQPYYPNTGELAALIENSVPNSNPNVLMHNKFAVFDEQKVFTGSMNFSTTGFSGFNANSVLVINSADAAKWFTQEFEQLYEGKKTAYQVRGDMQIYFSPQDKITTNHIIPLINAATRYIYVPAFIITHGGFAQSLIEAKARGVDVRVIIDATNPLGSGSKVGKLREAGVAVKTENYAGKMHSKSVIIDDKYVVIGSMNFSNSGEGKNNENVVILADAGIARFYRGYFEYLWTKIPERYLRINPRAESKWSIGSCEDGIDNNFDGKIDAADVGCQ
jgi:phosphatidylserine/phosphatidylglycerophosphate/cardiolipin synthase-like enzyme